MTDEPKAVVASPGRTPPEAVPTPGVPTPVPTPEVPAPTPAPEPKAEGVLSPDQKLVFPGADVPVPLGDVVEGYKKSLVPTEPTLDPQLVKEVELFRKATRENDAAAAKELVELMSPDAPVTPEAPKTPGEVQALTERLAQLEALVGQVTPTVTQIQAASEGQARTRLIDMNKEKLPFLAAHPQRGDVLQMALTPYREYAARNNVDLRTLPPEVQQKIYTAALTEANSFIQRTVEAGKGVETPTPESKPNITSVNDQAQPDATPGMIGPRWVTNADGSVSVGGVPAGTPPAPTTLPATPVAPAPPGTMPGAVAPEDVGPMTGDKMREGMKTRLQSIGGTQ